MDIQITVEDHVAAGNQINALLVNALHSALAENAALKRTLSTPLLTIDVPPEASSNGGSAHDTKQPQKSS